MDSSKGRTKGSVCMPGQIFVSHFFHLILFKGWDKSWTTIVKRTILQFRFYHIMLSNLLSFEWNAVLPVAFLIRLRLLDCFSFHSWQLWHAISLLIQMSNQSSAHLLFILITPHSNFPNTPEQGRFFHLLPQQDAHVCYISNKTPPPPHLLQIIMCQAFKIQSIPRTTCRVTAELCFSGIKQVFYSFL